MFKLPPVLLFLSLCAVPATVVDAGDWARFRGPNGTGISTDSAVPPLTWAPDQNLRWKTALPGAGVSSPIVVGQRVFVTCYSGYGGDQRDPGRIEDLQRHLLCIDRTDGRILWQQTVAAVQPEDPWGGAGIPSHGYASHTPVSDGEHVFVFFGKSGVLAFDFEGNRLWQTSVGTESDPRRWGSSSSPILIDDLLVVAAGPESRSLVGLNTATGDTVWKSEADGLANTWGTPAVVELEDGQKEIVIGTPWEIWGLNPDNGKLRWYCESGDSDQFTSSVVVQDDRVIAVEGRNGGSIALRAGGRGDVTETHALWTGNENTRFGTPLVTDGRIYFFSGGVAQCIDAATGERVFQGRLRGRPSTDREETADDDGSRDSRGPGRGSRGRRGGFGGGDYSSPVMAGDRIYYVTRSGLTWVIRASDTFEQLAANAVTDDDENFGATPAIADGELFLRSDEHLYCVAQETDSPAPATP